MKYKSGGEEKENALLILLTRSEVFYSLRAVKAIGACGVFSKSNSY